MNSLTLAPVSPELAKLLHQVQAQIIREAGEQSHPTGDLSLMPLGARLRFDADDGGTGYRSMEVRYAEGTFYMQTACCTQPKSAAPAGVWYGSETRRDGAGREWKRDLGYMVTDDFGNLAEVER